jgi:hypothetical protein
MSMFEHFSAGLPLFFPSKTFWKSIPNIQSMTKYWDNSVPTELAEMKNLSLWIELSDVYETFASPNTHYFDSFDHLFQLLETFVYVDTRESTAAYVANIQNKWQQITEVLRKNEHVKGGRDYGYLRSGRLLPM